MNKNNNRVVAIIPARYASQRFPGKPIAEIHNRPLIEWVVDKADSARSIEQVIVATDDERIMEVVQNTSARGVMTSSDHRSGSDRIAAVAEQIEAEIVVNVQGDEPLIKPENLDRGVEKIKSNPEAPVVTFKAPCPGDEIDDPDVVKVVTDGQERALYFSRSPLPYRRQASPVVYQHVGIYIYRQDYLLEYTNRKPTPLEEAESLEQLRILENGDDILLVEIEEPTVGVDRPGDIEKVEDKLRD